MNKDNLLRSLKLCRPALGGNIIRGLDSFHFSGRKVSAFNGTLLITTELEEDFPITGSISGESFYKLVSELSKEIELVATQDGNLVVKAGRSKSTFPVETVDLEFLADSDETAARTYLPTQLLFAAGLKRCMTTVGGKGIPQDEIGVHVFVDTPSESNTSKSDCRMYSTNGISYSRFICPLENETPVGQIFLPAAFCENLLFMYSELDTAPDNIVASQKYIRAQFGNTAIRHSFYSNPVNWEMRGQVDSGIEDLTVVDFPKDLIDALKRVEIISGDNSLKLHFGDPETEELYIHAQGSKNQVLEEVIPMPYPATGKLTLDLRGLRKSMESCREIGFGPDYVLLVHESNYDQIIAAKDV